MSYQILSSEVLDGFSTSAAAADVIGYIAVVDQADTCLAGNNVPEAIGKQLKILGVRHLLTSATQQGIVTQERAVSGASRSYAERMDGQSAAYATLRALDAYGCVTKLVSTSQAVIFRSIGRRVT